MKKAHILSILIAGAAVFFLAGGCGGSSTSPGYGSGGNNPGGGSSQITITNMVYSSLSVAKGTTVTWKNNDSIPHSATSDAGSGFAFDTGLISAGGTSSGITFTQSGTFTYHCTVHSSMHGSITVQ